MTDLQVQFRLFIERISLGEVQRNRIESAVKGLTEYLSDHYGILQSSIFIQGSFAADTTIKPLAGDEYDVDIVAVCAKDQDTENDALDDLEDALEAHGRYSGRGKPKSACIRLQYADETIGGFHVDVVPARDSTTASLEVPRRDEGWHRSAPAEFVAWCQSQGEDFARTTMALKRWRDDEPGARDSISSILLQVFAASHMPAVPADGPRLVGTLENLHDYLSSAPGVPEVVNPVLATEDLASRWGIDRCNAFRQHLAAAVSIAQRATNAASDLEAAAHWRELLGEDFPLANRVGAGIELGDTSHAQRPEARWDVSLDSNVSLTIRSEVFAGKRKLARVHRSDGEVLLSGWEIRFTAEVQPDAAGQIWWQVVNTGGHAREERNGLRGEFFKGRARGQREESRDERVNWEQTRYTGSHLVEAFLERNGIVVARSGLFVVNIANPRRRFSR